nr:SbcC/MukB-like Walker B domain-containing protein [Paraburkholderia sp. UCT31]
MLDALQTVMSAVYTHIFSYNPGQEETSQSARNGKSKRTLWSYIAGQKGNLFARPDGAHGYIAAVFRPSEGETSKPFTALVSASALIENRVAVQGKLGFIIVDDCEVSMDDFASFGADGAMTAVAVGEIEKRLRAKYCAVVNFRDSKREYLCQLYGRFRGVKSVSFSEAEAAAKAWVGSIVYQPIGSVDALVRTQILDNDPAQLSEGISQISDLMRQVSNLRRDGERLEKNIGQLETIQTQAKKAADAFESLAQFELLLAKKALVLDEHLVVKHRAEIDSLNGQIDEEQSRVETLVQSKEGLVRSQVQIQAALSGIPAADQKSRIEQRMDGAADDARTAITSLIEAIVAAQTLESTANMFTGMKFPAGQAAVSDALETLASALKAANSKSLGDLKVELQQLLRSEELDVERAVEVSKSFAGLNDKFSALHRAIADTQNGLSAALNQQVALVNNQIENGQKRERDLAARKAMLFGGKTDYPRDTSNALNLLREEFPTSRVQVLCDLIEPEPGSEWQAAIEGYMGGARFGLVVEPEWESDAIRLLRKHNVRANIIQGSLCLRNARSDRVAGDSIIHELRTDHPIAKAYLQDLYGNVLKVEDEQELRHTSRGVTKDGKASGGRSMYIADAHTLVFGVDAKRRNREAAERQHAEAEKDLKLLKDYHRELAGALALVGRVTLPSFSGDAALARAAQEIAATREDLARLDLSEVAKLEEDSKALYKSIRDVEEKIREADQRIGALQGRIDSLEKAIVRIQDGLAQKQGSAQAKMDDLEALVAKNPALSLTRWLEQVDAMLADGDLSVDHVQRLMGSKRQEGERAFAQAEAAVVNYNAIARGEERVAFNTEATVGDGFGVRYSAIIVLGGDVHAQLSVQREIGAVKNLSELRQAESSFKDVFTKQFCYKIRNAVDLGVTTLRSLNVELEKLKFGPDKFRIDWNEWVPEFREYYEFFGAACEMSEQESHDLFASTALSSQNAKVRDKLVELLLSEDQEKAQSELARIADYRNYRRYEIWRESDDGNLVALSTWGTGSGGELETPAYIVRAAVLTNRLKYFEKGSHLKLLVNDESFAKTDEARARSMIFFVRNTLGMQLISAMPTKHVGAVKPEFNKEWSFSATAAANNGELNVVAEVDERDLRPDELRKLWEKRREHVREQAALTFEAQAPLVEDSRAA